VTDRKAIAGELMAVCAGDDNIAHNLGVNDLRDDILVGEANNKTIFGGIVFVFILSDQANSCIIVSFALLPSTILDLKSFEVGFIFDNFDKPHV